MAPNRQMIKFSIYQEGDRLRAEKEKTRSTSACKRLKGYMLRRLKPRVVQYLTSQGFYMHLVVIEISY